MKAVVDKKKKRNKSENLSLLSSSINCSRTYRNHGSLRGSELNKVFFEFILTPALSVKHLK